MTTKVPTIGFISPPGWFDPSPAEFSTVCADPVRTQQCPLSFPGFDWRLESVGRTEPEMSAAARTLADMGCDLVAVVGTPFAFSGLTSVIEARARCERLAAVAGVPVVMSGIAIIDAFAALGAARVGLACTYYAGDWKGHWQGYVQASGLEVLLAETLADQGLVPAHDVVDRDFWAPSAAQIGASVRRLVATRPEVEAIAVSGAGARTLSSIAALEADLDRPVFGSDTALYWAAAKRLGLQLKPGVLGRLTDLEPG